MGSQIKMKDTIVLITTLFITITILIISIIVINKKNQKVTNIYNKNLETFKKIESTESKFKIQSSIVENEDGVFYKTPSFLVIGAMRSATNAVVNILRSHPKIHTKQKKELHFFDW